MRYTIFNTPGLSWALHWLARGVFAIKGWRVVGKTPEADKYVLIAAPHTSNWDFAYMLGTVFSRRLDLRWMGKHTLFPWGFGWFMRWLGGVPVNRSKAGNTVDQIVEAYKQNERFRLVLTPEGTRKKVDKWKSGFYRIAQQANVPLYLAAIDYRSKLIELLPSFDISGDFEADLSAILQVYRGRAGKVAEWGVN